MTKVMVFGSQKIMAKNPWAEAGMSDKEYYLRDPQPWVFDKSKLSGAQRQAINQFTDVAQNSIDQYPADGSFSTLQKRVKWIGKQLKGNVYTTVGKLKKRLPKSATRDHPLRQKIEKAEAAE